MHISADVLQQALHQDLSQYIDIALPGRSCDSSITEARCFILRDTLLKKFNNEPQPSAEACRKALDKFLAVNAKCGSWVFAPVTSGEEEMLNSVKQTLYDFWYVNQGPLISDFRSIFEHGRSGPGASVAARDTDFYTKFFDSKVSFTHDLHETWKQCASTSPLWADAERQRHERWGSVRVECSNYSFVNKNVTVARGICTEPSINMWMQLGVGRLLEERLRRLWGIDIRGSRDENIVPPQPDVNRVLALVGSIGDNLSTIDLESASDSLSMPMLQWLLPRSFFGLLCSLRCAATKLPNGKRVKLNMISTMGNGFTFPLETIVFAAVVIAVAKYSGVKLEKFGPPINRNFAIFGDDIICPRSITSRVLRVLELLGFTVNSDKTFVEGPFRESCGSDFISGQNVRGVYIKRLRTLQDLFVAINRLNKWSSVSGVKLPRTVGYLLSGIRRPHRFVVPPDENDDSGIKAPLAMAPRQKSTWRFGFARQYTAHVVSPSQFIVMGGHVWTYPQQKRRHYNESGAILCLLNGTIRGYCVTLRQREVQYTTKRKNTPNWGYFPPQILDGLYGSERITRFADACSHNMLHTGYFNT